MFDADLVSNDRVERDDYSPGDYLNQYHIEVEVVESHVEIAFPQFGRPDHSIFVYSRFEIRRKFEQYTKNNVFLFLEVIIGSTISCTDYSGNSFFIFFVL